MASDAEIRQVNEAYRECFSTPAGRLVLAHLEKENFARDQTYIPGSFDASAFNSGKRDVILRIQRRLAMGQGDKTRVAITEESI